LQTKFVYSDDNVRRQHLIKRLFDIEERGAERWPLLNDLQKRQFGIFLRFPSIFIEFSDN